MDTFYIILFRLFDPNVKLERHNFDITAFYNLKTFVDRIKLDQFLNQKTSNIADTEVYPMEKSISF
jgi:hypothetical protein